MIERVKAEIAEEKAKLKEGAVTGLPQKSRPFAKQILPRSTQRKFNTFFVFFQKTCCIFATLWYNKTTVKWCALAYHRAPRSYWRSFLVFFICVLMSLVVIATPYSISTISISS